MPQLAVGTFPSQIFWMLLGFFAVYIFISKVAAPNIESTLSDRSSHMNGLIGQANKLKTEAKKLEEDAVIALENAEIDSLAVETKLLDSFREQSIKEKTMLFDMFSKKSKAESAMLSTSADNVFKEMSENIDPMLELAMKSISCSLNKNDKNKK